MKISLIFDQQKKVTVNFRPGHISLNLFMFLLFPACLFVSINAQENIIKDVVPPPLSVVSKIEKFQLDAEMNLKKRTELSLDLMENRLKKAELFSSEQKYKESLDELGGFQAIMRNTLGFLQKNDNGQGKVLNNFKRLEINLRKFVPRLELVRRMMPEKFGFHVVQLMKSVRRARATAVEPLFDDNVVYDNNNKNL